MLSRIFIITDSEKDIKLANTSKVICSKDVSTVDSFKLYSASDKLRVHKINPMSLLSETECKVKVESILAIKGDIFCIGEGRLIKNMKESVLINEEKCVLINVNNKVGLQRRGVLEIYDTDLNKVEEILCDVSFCKAGVLLTSLKNHLHIYVLNKSLEFYLEEDITSLACDLLFTKVFCGTSSGKIYQINMDNKPNKILDYHQSPVLFLRISVCDRYLYSADEAGELLIWDDVVIDRVKDVKVKGMEVFL